MECTTTNRTTIMRVVWVLGLALAVIGFVMHYNLLSVIGIVLYISGAFGGGGA
jgi:hypothetical protein